MFGYGGGYGGGYGYGGLRECGGAVFALIYSICLSFFLIIIIGAVLFLELKKGPLLKGLSFFFGRWLFDLIYLVVLFILLIYLLVILTL